MKTPKKPTSQSLTVSVRLNNPAVKAAFERYCKVNGRSLDAQTRLLIEQCLVSSCFIKPDVLHNCTQ